MAMDVAAPAAMSRTVKWSDASAWPSGKVPAAGEEVTIPRGTEMVLDVSPPALGGLSIDGKLTFGSIDRLLPPPTGKPFALPDQVVDVEDVTVRLDTPWGRIGFALRGQGNLSDGFRGGLTLEEGLCRTSPRCR